VKSQQTVAFERIAAKMRRKQHIITLIAVCVGLLASLGCSLAAPTAASDPFAHAAYVDWPSAPLPLTSPRPKLPSNTSPGGGNGLSPNAAIPWQRTPPPSIPCTPPSRYCRTSISNAPYCTQWTRAPAGRTCAQVVTQFGIWTELFALMNPAVNCDRTIPTGTRMCVNGWHGWIPDDPSFGRGQRYPPVRGKSYQYCSRPGVMALTFDDGPHICGYLSPRRSHSETVSGRTRRLEKHGPRVRGALYSSRGTRREIFLFFRLCRVILLAKRENLLTSSEARESTYF